MSDSDLDRIGIVEGTNKSSMWVDYLRHYDRILREFRDQNICVAEIGVETGASLRMWERYFTKATIVGIDISKKCEVHQRGRIRVLIGSQDDPQLLDLVARTYSPTIIIDDGSHRPEHITFSFERLFPALLPGGLYIIEDLKGHFDLRGELRCGPNGSSPIISLTEWAQSLMSGRIANSDNYGIRKYLFQWIDALEFVSGAAIVRKKMSPLELAGKLAETEQLLRGVDNADSWSWFAAFVLKQRGPIELAERAARKAVEIAPAVPHHHSRLSAVLERKGDHEGAIAAAHQALDLAVGTVMHAQFKANLDRLTQLQAQSVLPTQDDSGVS